MQIKKKKWGKNSRICRQSLEVLTLQGNLRRGIWLLCKDTKSLWGSVPPSHASADWQHWILTLLCALALKSMYIFQYFYSPVRWCPNALHGQITSTYFSLLGPLNFPFFWCSVPVRISCSALQHERKITLFFTVSPLSWKMVEHT